MDKAWFVPALLTYPAALLIWYIVVKKTKFWRMSGVAKAVLQTPLLMMLAFGCVLTWYAVMLLVGFSSLITEPMTLAFGWSMMAIWAVLTLVIPYLLYKQLMSKDERPKDPPPFPVFTAILEFIGLSIGGVILLFVAATYVLRPLGISLDEIPSLPVLARAGAGLALIGSVLYGALAFGKLFESGSPYFAKYLRGLSNETLGRMRLGGIVAIFAGSLLILLSKLLP